MTDVQLARRATGVLADFNRLGVLGAADVHVAMRLGRLGGETDERVLLAVALTVRALRAGSVCLELTSAQQATAVEDVTPEELAALDWPDAEDWVSTLAASPIVAVGVDGDPSRPLRLIGETVYLDRYWRQEQRIAQVLDEAALREPPVVDEAKLEAALGRLFRGPLSTPVEMPTSVVSRLAPLAPQPPEEDLQRRAAEVAVHRWVSVLAGGPGTGKTTTVARLLAALQDQADGSLRVALAAPTAVAAKRLTLAARHAAESFDEADRSRLGDLEAVTLHRLLGWRPGSRTRFRHDHENRLPFDVVVVDEASMVSLTMMSRLVDALRPQARLVLVGDPDQLASIEAGAVLGDLVQRMEHDKQQSVVRLFEVHRYSTEIHALAEAVRSGQPDRVLEVLDRGDQHIEFVEDAVVEGLRDDVVAAGTALHDAARRGDGTEALQRLRQHQILCGHREGPYGVAHWTAQSEEWLRGVIRGYAADGRWYVGRPLLVTSNDYQLRLFNGDTGVVVDADGQARAAFLRDGAVDLLAPSRLSEVQTVHAMSVHRAQGSQYDRVTLVLPPVESPLLTRELLYTGLTRAKDHVRIIGTRDAVAAAVNRSVVRASGLRTRR